MIISEEVANAEVGRSALAVTQSPPSVVTDEQASVADRVATGWVVGPWFDCWLIANVGWPLLLLAQLGDGFEGSAGLKFWQVYFVTTPHRWITLLIVFLDRERIRTRPIAFIGTALLMTGCCVGVLLLTGGLTCLLAVDYAWNAWHFAAQHHGIYRIYGRASAPGKLNGPHAVARLTVEKILMRAFLLYVILRVAVGTWPYPNVDEWLQGADWIIVGIPLWLVCSDLRSWSSASWGRVIYLLSMSGLYLGLLGAVHWRQPALMLAFTTASALFHATEYLAIVSWAVPARHAKYSGNLGALSWIVPQWSLALCLYIVALGSAGWLMDQGWMQVWLFINVIAAFLHYAYDGIIWRGAR